MAGAEWWEELMLKMLKRIDPYLDHLLLSTLIPNDEKIAILNDVETQINDNTIASLQERLEHLDTGHNGFEAMVYIARCLIQILVIEGYDAVEVLETIRSQMYDLIAEIEAKELDSVDWPQESE